MNCVRAFETVNTLSVADFNCNDNSILSTLYMTPCEVGREHFSGTVALLDSE